MSERQARAGQRAGRRLLSAVMVFYLLAFLLLFLREYDLRALALAAVVPSIIFVGVRGIPKLFPADRLLLSLTNFLCALGVLVLYRLSPERGLGQAVNYLVGVAAMIACTLFVRYVRRRRAFTILFIPAGLALIALPLFIGNEINGARNWVSLGGFSFQPSEMVKLALLYILAFLLSRRKWFLGGVYAALCLGALMLQKDLGTALMYYGVTIVMLYVSTGSLTLVGIGLAGGAGAAVAGYKMFAHVRRRVSIWLNPWADPTNTGYQIVQGLIAMVNGGLWGVGLGLGNASVIPEYYNDFIFSVVLHEFGSLFGLMVLGMYLAIFLRGMMTASRARTRFDTLLAVGCSAMLALQTFVIVGGNIKLIPLTGITLPFISYGGTSLVSSLAIIGLLQGVAARNEAGIRADKALAGYEEGGA